MAKAWKTGLKIARKVMCPTPKEFSLKLDGYISLLELFILLFIALAIGLAIPYLMTRYRSWFSRAGGNRRSRVPNHAGLPRVLNRPTGYEVESSEVPGL